jgi:hypothetical protein
VTGGRAKARRAVRAVLLSAVCLGLTAPAASATFHEISIREVYPGSAANPGAEYVELQMWSSGQELVAGHFVRSFGAATQTSTIPSDVPRGANQSTIVLATPEAEAQFGIVADAALSPSGQLNPSGGAVCWEALDCMSWGGFGGSLPAPAGSPATPAGIPDGLALRRTIAPGCATLLEASDDRNNSAADFSLVFPAPRPNSVTPSERSCDSSGPAAGGPAGQKGRGAPQTTIKRKPAKRIRDRTPTFRFTSDEAGSTFQCKLDRKPFRSCRSPFTAKRLPLGLHTFEVRARDSSGHLDLTPATYAFRVIKGFS